MRLSTSPDPDTRFFVGAMVLMLATGMALIFVFIWPELRDWLIARTVVPVPIVAACPQPVEAEQLHIVVTTRDGRLVAECMHVGSTGTYYRRAAR